MIIIFHIMVYANLTGFVKRWRNGDKRKMEIMTRFSHQENELVLYMHATFQSGKCTVCEFIIYKIQLVWKWQQM